MSQIFEKNILESKNFINSSLILEWQLTQGNNIQNKNFLNSSHCMYYLHT